MLSKCFQLDECDDLDNEIDEILAEFEAKNQKRNILHTICFYWIGSNFCVENLRVWYILVYAFCVIQFLMSIQTFVFKSEASVGLDPLAPPYYLRLGALIGCGSTQYCHRGIARRRGSRPTRITFNLLLAVPLHSESRLADLTLYISFCPCWIRNKSNLFP